MCSLTPACLKMFSTQSVMIEVSTSNTDFEAAKPACSAPAGAFCLNVRSNTAPEPTIALKIA